MQIACRATDALEQALYARRPTYQGGLIHHSDRGGQYVSIRYTERLAKAGIEPSEVIQRRRSWKTMEEVELEILKWPYSNASIAYRLTGRLVQQPLAGSLEPVAFTCSTCLSPSETYHRPKQSRPSMQT
jgi:hypothetical protein